METNAVINILTWQQWHHQSTSEFHSKIEQCQRKQPMQWYQLGQQSIILIRVLYCNNIYNTKTYPSGFCPRFRNLLERTCQLNLNYSHVNVEIFTLKLAETDATAVVKAAIAIDENFIVYI